MQKWEYKTILRDRGLVKVKDMYAVGDWKLDIGDELSALGKQGWELVTVEPRSSTTGMMYAGVTTEDLWVFKRPIE